MDTAEKRNIGSIISSIRHSGLPEIFLFISGPVLMFTLVEYLNNNAPWRYFSDLQIFLNLFWYYLIFFLAWLAAGRIKLASAVSAVFFYLLGAVNHYLYNFRGRTLFPGDFLSIQTAVNVAEGYDYTPDRQLIIAAAAVMAYLLILLILPRRKGRIMPRLSVTIGAMAASVAMIAVFFRTPYVQNSNLEPSMWSTRGNGLVLNFCISLRYFEGEKPEGYSLELLAEMTQQPDEGADLEKEGPENVIVVMLEAFADLNVLGDFQVNEDPMPFWRGLGENCIKGFAYSSVFGGTTANAEYEFLTGNTLAYLPPGIVPFQLYINDEAPSIVSQLGDLGYRSVAMHPYLESGWNRVPVYDHLGFDESLFYDDFTQRSYMRNYITDMCDFQNLIRIYEAKEPGEKLFIYNVTMQNHSSYVVPYRGLPETSKLDGALKGYFPTVDQYLSLVKQSDLAMEYLFEYFNEVEEDTVILVFGDHQPQVNSAFFDLMLGDAPEYLDCETLQKKQAVPFCIWANYPIEEKDEVFLSFNYLSTFLVDAAGLPLTDYQEFLAEMHEEVPVINAVGLMGAKSGWTFAERDLTEEARSYLERYRMLQYANVFDHDVVGREFFYLGRDD